MSKEKKKSFIPWLYRMMKRRIPTILLLMLLSIFSSILNVRFALVSRDVIDSASGGVRQELIRACIVFALFIVMRIGATVLSMHLSQMVRANLDRDFKSSMLRKIYHSEYAFISHYHSADLVHRMNSDGAAAYNGVLSIATSLCSYCTSLIASVTMIISLEPAFAMFFILGTAVITLVTALIQRKMRRLHIESSQAGAKVSSFLHESINRLMVVQALDVSEEMLRRSEDVLEHRWQVSRRRKNLSLIMNLGSSGLGQLGSFVTMVWCAAQIFQGNMSFGGLTAMTTLVGQLQTSLMMLPHTLPQIIAISAACERVMEIEQVPDQPSPDELDANALYERMTGFRAEHLSFAYEQDPVIRDVSLVIPKGGLTVIMGHSGIGKSTLLKLMLGLYHPTSGELLIDTADGSIELSRAARSLFSYAPQGNFLLSGTLRDNLTLTNPDATEDQLRQALYVSCMEEYISTLPLGLDTPLRENGEGLSEGQAQRLSLARAILSCAPVLLLDEVTSALDAETEQAVLERICALPGKTCIAVTHRPAALALADHLIEVTESGMVMRTIHKCG